MSGRVKRVLVLFSCIAIAFGSFVNVSAKSNVLKVTSIENTGKSETATVETPSISENQIQGGIVFNAQGDYADYRLVIENTDDFAYRIDSVTDNGSTEALKITYEYGETIEANSTADLLMHLEYADLLLNQEPMIINGLDIDIQFTRIENPDASPNTSDGILGCTFGAGVVLLLSMFALRNVVSRRIKIAGSGVALVLAGSAAGVYVVKATTVEEDVVRFAPITLVSEYEDFRVTVDTGNGPVEQEITYGTPYSSFLTAPSKAGYHFAKWIDGNGNEINPNDVVTGPIAISAVMEPNKYHVVFKKNDGTDATTSQELTYDTAQKLAAVQFERPGYTFDGWATSADGDVVYADKESVLNLTDTTNDVELFAHWTKRTDIAYTIRHSYENLMDDNYTSEDVPATGSVDTDITPAIQPRTGYTNPEQKTVRIEADGSTIVEYDYKLQRVNLTFGNANYVQDGSSSAGKYKYGYPISVTAIDREGHDFAGWSNGSSVVSTNKTYNFNIHEDVELTPTYEIKKYTVTIDPNNGTAPTVHENVEYNSAFSTLLPENNPSKDGYHFLKWVDGSNNEITGESLVTGEMTVTASYEANTYHVVFNANGGSGEMASQEFTYDTPQKLTENSFTRGGYSFAGWATSADGDVVYANKASVSNLTTGTDDVSLYAKWTKNTNIHYVVRHSYENLMDDGYDDHDVEFNNGSVDTDITPAIEYVDGFIDPELKTEQINADGSSIIRYEYKRQRKNLVLKLTQYIDDSSTEGGVYKYGYPISVIALDRDGHDFAGWSNGTSIVSTDKTYNFNIYNDVELTPTYEIQKYTVTINDGTTPVVHNNVEYDTLYSTLLPENPSKTGHSFVNWTDGEGNVITGDSKVTGPATVTANFEANTYHVVFNANGATGEMESQEFTYGETKKLTKNGFEWPGYTFAGWATSADGDAVYADEAQVSNLTETTDDVELFAKWTKKTNIHYTVRHKYEDLMDDGYTNDDRDFNNGSVDTDITPAIIHVDGYIDPELKTERINADGSTIIEYEYNLERKQLGLENTEYIEEGSSAAGEYKYGYPISLTAAERTGYEFKGWYAGETRKSTSRNYEFEITESATLAPVYEINKYTVTVDMSDGNAPTEHANVEYGTALSTILPENPSKTGHAFVNWTDGEDVVTGETTVTKNMNIVANFQANEYRVVFKINNGTDNTAEQRFTYGETKKLTKNGFEWPGYTFAGWATSADGDVVYADEAQVSNLTETTDDVELFAKWTKRTDIHYTVIHRYEKLTGTDEFDDVTVDAYGSVDEDIYPERAPLTGFVTPEARSVRIDGNGTTQFVYEYRREKVELGLSETDYIDDGSSAAGEYRYGSHITLIAKSRTGYDFLGWYEQDTEKSTSTTYDFDITSTIELKPVYQIKSYAVTVDKKDGSALGEYTLDHGTALAEYLTEPSKTGYHLAKWMSGETEVNGETVVTGPMAIEAVLEANTYTIVFNANGTNVSGQMTSQEMTYDVAANISENQYSRPGYDFTGWATSADGEVAYADQASVSNLATSGNVDLYAKWAFKDIDYTIIHHYEKVTGNEEFDDVTVPAQGTVDTDIQPALAPETGFITPEQQTVQIAADGTTVVDYYYYRETPRLTLNEEYYIDTTTYTDNYRYGTEITLKPFDRLNYEFTSWQQVTGGCEAPNCPVLSTNSEYTFTLTEDITITPVFTELPFKYVFKHDGACQINSGAAVVGDDCGLHPELGYIDTGVKLYDEANYNEDYEIGFTIDSLATEQVEQATFLNAKYENSSSSAIGSGLVLRKGGQKPLEISHAVNGHKKAEQYNVAAGSTVRIIRFNGAIYYSINGGALTLLQAVRGTSDYKDTVTWFGASYDTYTDSPWRYLDGTLSNMYIKVGAYDGDTVTVTLDANGGTVNPESITLLAGRNLTNSGYEELPTPTGNGSLFFIDWYLDNGTWSQRANESTVFNSDTTIYARWEESEDVCAVFNDTTEYYETLAACVNAVPENTTDPVEIALLQDVNPATMTIPSSKKVILDGRNHTLTSSGSAPIIRNHGVLYIVDAILNGKANQSTVNNGTTEAPCTVATCHLFIDNSTITTSGTKQALWNKGGYVEIYGGAIISSTINKQAVHNLDGGTMKIIDATITSQIHNAVVNEGASSTLIIGTSGDGVVTNTPTITSNAADAIAASSSNTVDFYDGILSAKRHAISRLSDPTKTGGSPSAINAAAISNSPEPGYNFMVTNDGNTSQTTTLYYEPSNGS